MVVPILPFTPSAVWAVLTVLLAASPATGAVPFTLPTANAALFEENGGPKFLVGTPGKDWQSGCFGCVRTEGWQMHEGLDIRCLTRDQKGEPTDPVMAAADGAVVHVNSKSSLSTYGIYLVLQHRVEGFDVFTLYAHLRNIRAGLKPGTRVQAGDLIATMGRTSNTSQTISRERAHLHFEIALLASDRFQGWYKKTYPTQRNDHGQWNGFNLLGLDPQAILLQQHAQGDRFSLLQFIRTRPELCRVLVRKTNFHWLRRYPALIRTSRAAEKEGIAGYELKLDFNGVPFEAIPKAESEIRGKTKYQLLSVNEAEYRRNPCRRLVTRKGTQWALAPNGTKLLDLVTFN